MTDCPDNVFHFPHPDTPRHGWPVFDMPRPETGFDGFGERRVLESSEVVMRVDATDEFVRVPVRIVFTTDGLIGFALEIGPYSIAGTDACLLANMLVKCGQMSGEFRRASQGETA